MRRSAAVLAPGIAVLTIAGPALAGWAAAGSGTGTVAAGSVAPATGLTTTAGTPSHSAIDVGFTPASNPPGTTYTVTRDKKKDGTAGPQVACSGLTASPCSDTGLTASTTYAYTVTAVVGSWSKPSAGSVSGTTAAAPDTVAPTVTISCARTTGSGFTCNGTYGQAAGDVAAVTLTVTNADGTVSHRNVAVTAAAGQWTYTGSGLRNGTNSLVARQLDAAGNEGTASTSLTR